MAAKSVNALSDNEGRYEINVPFESNIEEVRLILTKSGYKTEYFYVNLSKDWIERIVLESEN